MKRRFCLVGEEALFQNKENSLGGGGELKYKINVSSLYWMHGWRKMGSDSLDKL